MAVVNAEATPLHAVASPMDVVPSDVVTMRQVHGTQVRRVTGHPPQVSPLSSGIASDSGFGDATGDALLTTVSGTAVGVRTADCVPILLWSRDGAAVAAVHAGWRGSVAGIAPIAVAALAMAHGCAPDTLSARIGPCIGACCYEVDEAVLAPLRAAFPHWVPEVVRPHRHLDLARLNQLQLEAAGVQNIHVDDGCTCCEPQRESYRRDGAAAGRMVSWIRAT